MKFPVRSLTLIFVAVTLTMRIASVPTANLSYIMLACFALSGRAQALQALALSWLFTMLSPGIGAAADGSTIGRYAVLFGAVLSVMLRSRLVLDTKISYTLFFGLFIVVHSFLFSQMPDVSLLKAGSWVMALGTILSAWLGLSHEQRQELEQQIFYGLVVLMLASLPLLAMPLGYLRNGTGFQGILNHPQAFGPTMAVLGAWAAGRWFGELRSNGWLNLALSAVCFILVIMSEARTAGFSMFFGIVIAVTAVAILPGRTVKTSLPNLKAKHILTGALLLLLVGIVGGEQLAERVSSFVDKSGRAGVSSLLEAYEVSRGPLAERMWLNIESNPFRGIGFGIASDPFLMNVERDPLFGLPISATIEKGILPLAVWEEIGALGLALFIGWLFLLLKHATRHSISALAVSITALLLNLGESTFFSPGGIGLLSLILFGWALTGEATTEKVRSK